MTRHTRDCVTPFGFADTLFAGGTMLDVPGGAALAVEDTLESTVGGSGGLVASGFLVNRNKMNAIPKAINIQSAGMCFRPIASGGGGAHTDIPGSVATVGAIAQGSS